MLPSISDIYTYKIVLAGAHNSGKTMFLWRVKRTEEEYNDQPTIGADFICKDIFKKNSKYKVHIWDTAGQEIYHSITAPYFRSCNGILLFFDLTDVASFNNLDYWMDLIKENVNTMPIIYLIGNKSDLVQTVPDEAIEEYARKTGLKYFKVSAKDNTNTDNVLEFMISAIIESQIPEKCVDTIPIPKKSDEGKCC